MPIFQYEAMDKTGQEVQNTIEAENQEQAQATIKQLGLFVTKISLKKARGKGQSAKTAGARKGKTFVLGGVNSKVLTTFTRQLAILQEAGLPILRSLKILEQQAKPGAEELADQRLRGDRERLDALRGHGQVAQGLQPPVRQHDQGRRGGRRWRSSSNAWPSSRNAPSR